MKDTSQEDPQAAIPSSDQLLNKAFKNASLLMALQIFAKVMTMSMNFLVARFVQKEIYGYANIQMQLFYSMILFYSKEAVRRACQREVQIEGQSKEIIHRSALNLVTSFSLTHSLGSPLLPLIPFPVYSHLPRGNHCLSPAFPALLHLFCRPYLCKRPP
jgi:hypothetical protein